MYSSDIKINDSLNTSKVQQLVDAIMQLISADDVQVGDLLPSVNQLNRDLGLSRDTVFKAYKELIRRGMIESTPTKGYYVASENNRVFLLLDSYSPFKDVLYDSFVKTLGKDYHVDLAFHHYNFRIFETVILNSIGKYNMYVIMNFNNEKISDVLRKIDPKKLLILDWGKYKDENFSYVCQDFGSAPYACLEEAKQLLKKYKTLYYYCPDDSVHPETTYTYFQRFCNENDINYSFLKELKEDTVAKGAAFFIFRQKDLVDVLKYIKVKKLKMGKEVGVLAYNDAPLLEVIENGITCISTDFVEMGKKAAGFIKTKEKTEVVIPTKLILRGSL